MLGRGAGNPVVTTFLVFAVGILGCLFALATLRPTLPSTSAFAGVPWYAWLGGVLGMFYIVLVVTCTPRLGVGLTTMLILVGQMTIALMLDHFGALGNAPHPINVARIVGLILMISGTVLIKRF